MTCWWCSSLYTLHSFGFHTFYRVHWTTLIRRDCITNTRRFCSSMSTQHWSSTLCGSSVGCSGVSSVAFVPVGCSSGSACTAATVCLWRWSATALNRCSPLRPLRPWHLLRHPPWGEPVTPREPGLPPPIPSRGFGNLGFKVHEGFINNVSEFPLDNGSRVCTSRDLFCHRPLF